MVYSIRYYWGKKFVTLIFVIFLQVRRTVFLKLFGSQEGVIRFQNFSIPQVCQKKEIFLQQFKKSYLSISKKNQAKITPQIAKLYDLPRKNSLSSIIASEIFLLRFLSYQADYASCHQCCRYICQSLITYSKFQKKNVINARCNFFYVSNESFQLFNQ